MTTRVRYFALGGGLLAVALLALFLVLGPGSGASDGATTTTAAPTTTTEPTTTTAAPTTTSEPLPVAPLTGLGVRDEEVLARPALIVKVDNADRLARPQAGIGVADVVYEEQVEGGVTRFAAVFHSRDAEQVGPVRSARSTDVGIATPLNQPLFSFSGANRVFMDRVVAAPLVELSYDWHPELYTRRGDRRAPDNIFTPTSVLWSATPEGAGPPPPLFEYLGEDDELPDAAARIARVDYHFGGSSPPVAFEWSGEAWARTQNGTPHVDEADQRLEPTNVVVQFVDYLDTGLVDAAGSQVPEAQLVGEGDAWVLTQGHAVAARWRRPSAGDVTTYLDPASGEPVRLEPGSTWVVLAPPGSARLAPCADAPDAPGCS